MSSPDNTYTCPVRFGYLETAPRITDAKAIETLKEIAADEWNRPITDHLAAQWALDRIEKLEGKQVEPKPQRNEDYDYEELRAVISENR